MAEALGVRSVQPGGLACQPNMESEDATLVGAVFGDISVGRAFAELGWEVVSLDLHPKSEPTIFADVCSWEPLPMFAQGYFDMIWASPPLRSPQQHDAGAALQHSREVVLGFSNASILLCSCLHTPQSTAVSLE